MSFCELAVPSLSTKVQFWPTFCADCAVLAPKFAVCMVRLVLAPLLVTVMAGAAEPVFAAPMMAARPPFHAGEASPVVSLAKATVLEFAPVAPVVVQPVYATAAPGPPVKVPLLAVAAAVIADPKVMPDCRLENEAASWAPLIPPALAVRVRPARVTVSPAARPANWTEAFSLAAVVASVATPAAFSTRPVPVVPLTPALSAPTATFAAVDAVDSDPIPRPAAVASSACIPSPPTVMELPCVLVSTFSCVLETPVLPAPPIRLTPFRVALWANVLICNSALVMLPFIALALTPCDCPSVNVFWSWLRVEEMLLAAELAVPTTCAPNERLPEPR